MPQYSHQLAAIMFTDIQDYTALMQRDEGKAVEFRNRHREVFSPVTEKFNGKILQYFGDGTLSTFSSAIDAVRCGIEMQLAFQEEPQIPIRIGIHTGDILVSEEDIIGDGVNVASRIESLAAPGSVFISEKVYDEVKNQSGIQTASMGVFELKNVDRPMEVFAISNPGLAVPQRNQITGKAKSESPGQGGEASTKGKTVAIKWVLAVLATILVGYLVYEISTQPIPSTDQIYAKKSIAVLPFKTIGGDREGEYFAEGVREEILNHLTRIEDLHVKSRSAVDRFEDSTASTQELVSELKLTHYLEGSARKEGNRVRITVQFIDASNNEHLWAENYDRNYDNIWDTQSEIAKKVAEALKVEISPEIARVIEKKPTDNPQAWDDFLKALYYGRRFLSLIEAEDPAYVEAGRKMVVFLKASIRKDPNFALGYSWLASTYRWSDPSNDSTLILINKAIELDPLLSEPYIFRGEYHAYVDNDTMAAFRDFKQAISNGPHLLHPYWSFAEFYKQRGDVASALKFIFQALQRQPNDWELAQMLFTIGLNYLEVTDYQKAEYYLDKALVYDPDNLTFLLSKGQLYLVTGQNDLLLSLAQRIMEVSPSDRGLFEMGMYYLMVKEYETSTEYFGRYFSEESKPGARTVSHMYGYALLKTGRLEEANRWFEIMKSLIREHGHESPDYEYAKIYSAKGMIDSAYFHLQKAVAEPLHLGLSDFIERDPLFENIKDEPEFQRLVQNAKEKVNKKRDEVRKLEESGEIPTSLDEIELF